MDHNTPHKEGYHPEHAHLVYFEIEPRHSMYILTTPAKKNNALISSEDVIVSLGVDFFERGYGYASDELLDIFK